MMVKKKVLEKPFRFNFFQSGKNQWTSQKFLLHSIRTCWNAETADISSIPQMEYANGKI